MCAESNVEEYRLNESTLTSEHQETGGTKWLRCRGSDRVEDRGELRRLRAISAAEFFRK